MHLHTKEQAVKRMNNWGLLRRPFIFIINYLQDASYVEEISSVDPTELLYNLNGFTNQSTSDKSNENSCLNNKKEHIHWQAFPESSDIYRHSFNIVQRNIFAGNSFLTNLTCRTPIETNLTLQDIYFRSKAIYKLWLRDSFTVFSPEIFVRIHQRKISSYPMKGTIDASIPDASRLLMDDPKEAAEHATIVDLIRNDLSMVANQVSVSRYRYIDTLHTNQGAILQTSSEIQGVLPEDYQEHLGEIIFKLLPAGSITGAPKKKTMQIIQEAESYDRGFYTGIMGYFDGENLDSAVMIRFVEQEGEKMYFKSGGGITCQSDVESEYNEMKQKVYVPIY
ncbi:aminodeoxychorismate synthase component I [uncultured Bacteroides sp.]|uniref:aminodeoxychorismate synthase component I n=1 Tax=uncultured Bacteroides sp. TaxID=162156 RepID=UPI0025DDB943|nr:aminodeoxychorismate synthase component I [uncultured Bacteroides sp.]